CTQVPYATLFRSPHGLFAARERGPLDRPVACAVRRGVAVERLEDGVQLWLRRQRLEPHAGATLLHPGRERDDVQGARPKERFLGGRHVLRRQVVQIRLDQVEAGFAGVGDLAEEDAQAVRAILGVARAGPEPAPAGDELGRWATALG